VNLLWPESHNNVRESAAMPCPLEGYASTAARELYKGVGVVVAEFGDPQTLLRVIHRVLNLTSRRNQLPKLKVRQGQLPKYGIGFTVEFHG